MRWRGRRQSSKVEDRRGQSPSGGGMRFPMGRVRLGGAKGGLGLGGLIVMLLAAYFLGVDPTLLLRNVNVSSGAPIDVPNTPSRGGGPPPSDEGGQFVSVVLADTEDVWTGLFQQMGRQYRLPTLVLFEGQVASACGFNSAAVGPFYCPGDQQVYIDLSFFRELSSRFGAPGDFAQAYVIAHEVGHHVQNLLGISREVRSRQARMSKEQANQLSVRLELQADCFAGVWGNQAQQYLEPGDVEEGLRAAAAIGDDTIQRRAGAYVHPESWTHGSSEMRVEWLRRGMQSGSPTVCDTFGQGGL